MSQTAIRPRDRDAIIQSLRAGVVPRIGLQHIQVARADEIISLLTDLDRLVDGGSGFRLVIGEYGSGKTFFLTLIRSLAHEKKLVTVNADLSPDRRLHATGGKARSLYSELMRNLATRARPEGGALAGVVEKFVTSAIDESRTAGRGVGDVIAGRLESLKEMVGGYDFASVVSTYWHGYDAGDSTKTSDAIRWLRAEYSTRTEARSALGVRNIIDDDTIYDHLKLMARFVRLSGFGGLVVTLDEMVNLYKLGNSQARSGNYEQILRILNDSFQAAAEGLGFLLGGTPEFLMDPRRGLFGYPALASRLGENTFAQKGLVDNSGPVIRLANLTTEDLYILLQKIRNIHAMGAQQSGPLPDEAIEAFMMHCSSKIGATYFRTPRTTIRAFLDMLAVLEQNPQTEWTDLVAKIAIHPDVAPDTEMEPDDDGLSSLHI